jgi:hypothetical protein
MSMKNKHENTDYCCTIEEDGDSPKVNNQKIPKLKKKNLITPWGRCAVYLEPK